MHDWRGEKRGRCGRERERGLEAEKFHERVSCG